MSTVPRYRFGVSEFTTWPWSFEEDVERYARLGVDTIEVCEFKLDESHMDGQLALLRGTGMDLSSVQPAVRTLFPSQSQPEPKDIGARMARFKETVRRFGDLGQGVPFVTNTGNPPNGNIEEVFEAAANQYRDVADAASEWGALVALEPLNSSIVNIETAIWTLQQGLEIVQAVDRPNFGICLDAWNIWQNADLYNTIRACGDRTFVVQLSDWRTPRSFQDRLIPGQGDIPLAALLRAVRESGYDGPYVVEIFSGHVPNSLWDGDLNAVIEESRRGVDRAWEESFSLG